VELSLPMSPAKNNKNQTGRGSSMFNAGTKMSPVGKGSPNVKMMDTGMDWNKKS
jgi:hypothetical protein